MKAIRKKSKKRSLAVKKKTPDKPHGRGWLKGALMFMLRSIVTAFFFVLGCVIDNLIGHLFHNYFYETFSEKQRSVNRIT